jgi:predicted TPR repeat methyltransferase
MASNRPLDQKPAVGERLAAAMREHQRGNTAEAERVYESVLAEYPDDANAAHLLGMLRFHAGEREAGLALVQRSLETDPANAHAWNNLGNMYRTLLRPEDAERAYLTAIARAERFAPAWYNLARIYEHARQYEDAIRCLREVLRMTSGFVEALHTLASLYYRLGRPRESREVYRQWAEEVPDDPTPRHLLAGGSSVGIPDRADDRYIVQHFDSFADSFEDTLKRLGYRAPELLAAHLIRHPLYLSGRAAVLDAGCGTGWCGPLLRSTAARLVGADLSPKMLAQARERGVYDELHESELNAYMRANRAAFDIIVSADVLCYFGRLDQVMAAARGALKPDGLLGFSVEALPAADAGVDFRLGDAGRYLHARGYCERMLADAGFLPAQIETATLRNERGEPVEGFIVVARIGT